MPLVEMTGEGFFPVAALKPLRVRNAVLTHNGETHTLAEWSERTGIPYKVIYGRMTCGMPSEKVLHVGRLCEGHGAVIAKRYAHDGESLTAAQWAARLGISIHTFRKRLADRLTGNALFCPSKKPRRGNTQAPSLQGGICRESDAD